MVRLALLNRGMEDSEAGRLRVVKQLAYSKLLSISLNNSAAYERDVEDGNSGEQSGKAEKIVMHPLRVMLLSRYAKDQHVSGKQLRRTLICAPIASHDHSCPT